MEPFSAGTARRVDALLSSFLDNSKETKMLKTLLMSAAIGGLVMSGALAQGTPAGDAPKVTADAPKADAPKFVPSQGTDQWVFSKFKGTDVVGPSDEAIGSINDILFDKSGKIMAMIVGVGGFLGIGQKNVAMDMSAFQVVPASTGSTTTSSNDPTNVKLKVAWTKDQLMQAPDFQYYKPPASTVGSGQQRTPPATPAVPPAPRP
jgi:hypothetical protein